MDQIEHILFYNVEQFFYEKCVMSKAVKRNEHLSNIDFGPLPSLVKAEIIKKNRKQICKTTVSQEYKSI